MPVEVSCATCGKRVLKRPYEIKRAKHHYCSHECHLKQQRNSIEHSCEQCGKKIIAPASKKNKKFCSSSCYGKSLIGGTHNHKHPYYKIPIEKIKLESYYKNHSMEECGEYFKVSATLISQWLKKYDIITRKRLIYPRIIECDDGHKVRSSFERRVDDWLFLYKISHEYEPTIAKIYKADFKVGGHYIEVWGMDGYEQYDEHKKLKQEAYQEKGIKLIEITADDINNGLLDEKLAFLIPLYGNSTKTLSDYI